MRFNWSCHVAHAFCSHFFKVQEVHIDHAIAYKTCFNRSFELFKLSNIQFKTTFKIFLNL